MKLSYQATLAVPGRRGNATQHDVTLQRNLRRNQIDYTMDVKAILMKTCENGDEHERMETFQKIHMKRINKFQYSMK